MKVLSNILLNLFIYYAAGWLIIWIVAVACGIPVNVNEWHDVPRILIGTIGAPVLGGLLAHYVEENK